MVLNGRILNRFRLMYQRLTPVKISSSSDGKTNREELGGVEAVIGKDP